MKTAWCLLLALLTTAPAAAQAPPGPAADSLAAAQLPKWPAATRARLLGRTGLADTARLQALARPGAAPALRLAALRRLGAVYLGPAGRGGWALARSLASLRAGYALAEARRDTTGQLDFAYNLGDALNTHAGQSNLALLYLIKGRKLAEARHDTARLIPLTLAISFCRVHLHQPQAVLTECRQLLRYAVPVHDLEAQSHAYSTFGDAYNQLGNHAAQLANDVKALARQAHNPRLIGIYYGNLVQPNVLLHRYAEANRLLDSAFLLRDPRLDPWGRDYLRLNKAELLLKQGRLVEARPWADTALRFAQRTSEQQMEHYALDLEVPILTGLGRYREALAMQMRRAQLDDSTFQVEAHRHAEELQALYETEKQQAQLARQRQRIGGWRRRPRCARRSWAAARPSFLPCWPGPGCWRPWPSYFSTATALSNGPTSCSTTRKTPWPWRPASSKP